MLLRIDAGGNVLFGTDTASTDAFHMVLYLVALLSQSQDGIQYDPDSGIKDIQYDPETTTITWEAYGSTQSYVYNTMSMQSMLNEAIHTAFPELTIELIEQRVRQIMGVASSENVVGKIAEGVTAATTTIEGDVTSATSQIIDAMPSPVDLTVVTDAVAASEAAVIAALPQPTDLQPVLTAISDATDLVVPTLTEVAQRSAAVASAAVSQDVSSARDVILDAIANQGGNDRDAQANHEDPLALASHVCSITSLALKVAESK